MQEMKNEKGGREKFFNATIKSINSLGMMQIYFDEKVDWNNTP